MERRTSKRVETNLRATIFSGDHICSGAITNISENGMYINADISLPLQIKLEVLLHTGEDFLKLPVKVRRLTKSSETYKGIGVELLSPTDNYLNFVNTLKSVNYPSVQHSVLNCL